MKIINLKNYHVVTCLVIILTFIISVISSCANNQAALSITTDKLVFKAMLLEKESIDSLLKANSKLKYIIFQAINKNEIANRDIYELSMYAYDSSDNIIASFNRKDLLSSATFPYIMDKTVLFANLKMTRAQLTEIVHGSSTYQFVRFQPFYDSITSDFKNYIRYKVYIVANESDSSVHDPVDSAATAPPPKKLDPSPPAKSSN